MWQNSRPAIAGLKAFVLTALLLLGSGGVRAADAPVAEVNGFRSARFGMTEQEVRAAITKDFNAKASAIKMSDNLTEQTKIVTVSVPELLPKGGTADVNYTLGYKTKRLIQVTVLWSKATDPAITTDMIVANGTLLASYFQGAGYKPETVVTNVPNAGGGLIVFQGSDGQGRTTALLYHGQTVPGENGGQTLTPNSLTLAYIADPKNPDVYRLAPGQF